MIPALAEELGCPPVLDEATILTALEAKPGESLAPPVPATVADSPIAAVVAGLRGVPVDLAIAKLRTMVPADVAAQAPKISIPLIQVPRR